MTELVKKLMFTSGVSGREDKISEVIRKEVEPYADEVYNDPMGNLVAHKKGNGKKVMFAAHMDEIGYFVTFIDDRGLIKVGSVGGINTLAGAFTQVVSENGVYGVIVPSDSKDIPKCEDLYIDIGVKTKKQAEAKVKVGDYFVHVPAFRRLNGTSRYIGRPFDDRVGCAILVETLKNVKNTDNDLYFVFTVQEEVGSRGARPATYHIEPEIGIAIDVTRVGGKPGSPTMDVKLGGGAAIKIKDSSVICSYEIVNKMRELAKENKVKYQDEMLVSGGTDTSVMQISKGGCLVGAISIPSAYIHSVNEMIDMGDVKEIVKLATLVAERI